MNELGEELPPGVFSEGAIYQPYRAAGELLSRVQAKILVGSTASLEFPADGETAQFVVRNRKLRRIYLVPLMELQAAKSGAICGIAADIAERWTDAFREAHKVG